MKIETIRRTRAEFERLESERRSAIKLGMAALALMPDEDAERAARLYAINAVLIQEEINRSVVE